MLLCLWRNKAKWKKDIEYTKEDIKLLRDTNKETADWLRQIEIDFEYGLEDAVKT